MERQNHPTPESIMQIGTGFWASTRILPKSFSGFVSPIGHASFTIVFGAAVRTWFEAEHKRSWPFSGRLNRRLN